MPLDLTTDKSTLVWEKTWCCQATSQYLSQSWLRFMSPYGVTRPQWVNSFGFMLQSKTDNICIYFTPIHHPIQFLIWFSTLRMHLWVVYGDIGIHVTLAVVIIPYEYNNLPSLHSHFHGWWGSRDMGSRHYHPCCWPSLMVVKTNLTLFCKQHSNEFSWIKVFVFWM